MNDELKSLLQRAKEQFDRLTPEEQARVLEEQAQSWVRGEMAMGNDAQEAKERARYREKMNRHSLMYKSGRPKLKESDFDV
jgi:hypothetical protein